MHGMRNRNQRPRPSHPPGAGNSGPGRGPRQNNSSGNPQRNYERYIALARAAVGNGDPIEAENCYQHAEHYFRVLRGE
jgi:Domain of unknown function (DUF4167)